MQNYALIQKGLEFISENAKQQPSIEVIAAHLKLSPLELNSLFRTYCGLTPMSFLQALTLDYAKGLLKNKASLMDASFEAGLSSSSRLHDLFVTHEALSPGEYAKDGEGLVFTYGYSSSPFGLAIAVKTPRGLAGLGFCNEGEEQHAFEDMQQRWKKATFLRNDAAIIGEVNRVFNKDLWQASQPLKLFLIGTNFEITVWETLLKIPMGQATTYGSVAHHIQKPTAARAVGAAVGRNPLSFVVPCHRVIGQSGALTGYHWGLNRKRAMLGWEKGQIS